MQHLDVVGNTFVGRVGCSGFGDLPGLGHFPYAKNQLEKVGISYSR